MNVNSEPQTARSLIPRAAWDFDLGGCPAEELEHCCFYEYALESPSVKGAVVAYRRNRQQLAKSDDRIGNLSADRWFGSPFRVLVDHQEFPDKHWLEIAPGIRAQKVRDLPPYSQTVFSNQEPKYQGPQPSHLMQLQGEMVRWKAIEEDKAQLRSLFEERARSSKLLRTWPDRLKAHLTDLEIAHWTATLSSLSGQKLRNAANNLRLVCGKRIEKFRRQDRELVVYKIDWTRRPTELVEQFRRWIKANSVHQPRGRSGGHPTKAVELLRALGAKRVFDFFEAKWGSLPREYECKTMEAAVSDYTVDQRRSAGRPDRPLYRGRRAWTGARLRAADHFKEHFS